MDRRLRELWRNVESCQYEFCSHRVAPHYTLPQSMSVALTSRILGLATGSAIQVASLALLSLLLAKMLPVEQFGVTRSVTAYMVILTMVGHFALHDAVAAFAAGAKTSSDASVYVMHGIVIVVLIGSIVAGLFSLLVRFSGIWNGELRNALSIVVIVLPIEALGLVLSSLINAVIGFRQVALFPVVAGIASLAIVVPAAAIWGLEGWIGARMTSIVLVCGVAAFWVRAYIRPFKLQHRVCAELLGYSRIQVVSGILSMLMQSADIILLERITKDPRQVAVYGLASLFAKSVLFVPAVMGRLYFREIANPANSLDAKWKVIWGLLYSSLGLGLILALGVVGIGPPMIESLYGKDYENSITVLGVMSLLIPLFSLWGSLSTINIALKLPGNALRISAAGVTSCILMLTLLVPIWGPVGAAWALNGSYLTGVIVGVSLLLQARNRERASVSSKKA